MIPTNRELWSKTNESRRTASFFAKREQELLDNCRIKSEEQFIGECKKAGINEDWYAFTCDRSKPVSMDKDAVYYGKSGKTIVSYEFQRWGTGFDSLEYFKLFFSYYKECRATEIDDYIEKISGLDFLEYYDPEEETYKRCVACNLYYPEKELLEYRAPVLGREER